MASPKPNVQSLFGRAAELSSPDDRAALLEAECAGHPDVRAEVETLLKALNQAGSFMRHPAAPQGETGDYEPPISEGEGTVIGPYILREQIGEGGMGLVFVAAQQQPVRRKVALKVIKPGMDTRQVVARFEAERQALALMDHPNIAKVLDAGTTASGLPYFVMELVKGVPITEYADTNNLTPDERLELFIQVCNAVQHAHQKGVIHRDLKPSNILVAPHDGVPVVKVIDFGVAKALGQSLTEKTIYTRFAQMIGTPLYMSPEQAEVNQLDVDTRSDVYSLGVLLYELLTGTTPFDRQRFAQAAFEEIRRIIKEEEPPRPSTRLTSLGATLTAVSAKRGTEPGKLAGLVRGELDWIVMRCLEKDRTRRYDGAAALAKDVQRYLSGDAVEACPPTVGYRLKKAYSKNRAAVRVGSAFVCLMVGAVVMGAVLAVRATDAERDARAEATRADDERGKAVSREQEANNARHDADKRAAELKVEQDRTRRLLYASQMSSASMAFAEGRCGQLIRLLDEAAPQPGEPDLRNWEWHFLDRQTRPDREFKVDTSGWPKTDPSLRQFGSGNRNGWVDAVASRSGRWIVARRAVREGFVFDIHEAATGRQVGQVPKSEILQHPHAGGLSLFPLLSEDGKHLLVAQGRLPAPFETGGKLPLKKASPETVTHPRMWDVVSGREVSAPPGPIPLVIGSRDLVAVGRGETPWVAWLEPVTPLPQLDVKGPLRQGVKGPVKYSVARWEAATGMVTQNEVTIGTGWGIPHLGPDGRSVFWYPTSERSASGNFGVSSSDPIEYGEFQRCDVENPLKVQVRVRVPVSDGPGAQFVALSASWDMLAVLDRQQVTVYALSDGHVHWQVPLPTGIDASDSGPMSRRFAVSDDGNRVVFHGPESVVVVEKSSSGKPSERRFGYRNIPEANGRFNVVRNFSLLPDGRTLVRQDFDTVRVWDVTRSASDFRPPTGGGRKLVTDADGRSWFVLRTADGRRTVKWSPPPGQDDAPAAENAPPRQLFLLDSDGKELGKLDLGPTRSTEVNWLSRALVFVDSDRRLLLNTIRPKDARPSLTYLSPPPAPNTQGITEWTREWALYDLEKPGFERVAGGGGDLYPIANSPYLLGLGATTSFRDQPSSFAVYDARTGGVIHEFRPPPSARFTSLIPSRLIDSTGRRVVMTSTTGSKDDSAAPVRIEVCESAGKRLWSAELADVQFQERSGITGRSFQVAGRFTPDGKRVVVDYMATDGMRLGVWSATTGVLERTLSLTTGPERSHRISDFALAPDGDYLAVSLSESGGAMFVPQVVPKFLDVWNLNTGVRVQRLTGFAEGFGQITLSTDATRLFATERTPAPGTPGRLRVWDVATGRELLTLLIDYGPNRDRFVLRSLRYEAGKLHLAHPDWEQTFDGTPVQR